MRDKTSERQTMEPTHDLPYGSLDKPLDTRRTELLAQEFWRVRGYPEGSPEVDWFLAEEQLRHEYGLVNAAQAG